VKQWIGAKVVRMAILAFPWTGSSHKTKAAN
jgi:hypothetical protein